MRSDAPSDFTSEADRKQVNLDESARHVSGEGYRPKLTGDRFCQDFAPETELPQD